MAILSEKYGKVVDRIITSVKINKFEIARVLWDTGANCCCISYDLVKKLNLKPIGAMPIATPSGTAIYNKYMINIELSNGTLLNDVTVCESEIGAQKLDLIIGMNIINKGDFAISNFNSETKFSFRIPTSANIEL